MDQTIVNLDDVPAGSQGIRDPDRFDAADQFSDGLSDGRFSVSRGAI